MKRIFTRAALALALLAGGTQAALAQDFEAPKYHLGIRAGYSETNVLHDFHLDSHGDRNRQSFVAGIDFDYRIVSRPLYLETGLYGSNRGVDVRDGSRRYAENNFALMVPVLLSYHFLADEKFNIDPFVGPYFAYNCGFKQMDYGLRFGCGFVVKQVTLHLGCDLGLKDEMFHNEQGERQDDGLLTSLYVTLGWNFLSK